MFEAIESAAARRLRGVSALVGRDAAVIALSPAAMRAAPARRGRGG